MPKGATTKQTAPGARTRPPLTRFLWPGAMFVVGAGVIALAWFKIYPQPETPIPVPASPSLVVYTTSGHVTQITYMVTNDAAGLPEMQITVSVGTLVRDSVVPLPVPTQGSSLEVTLPPGLAFRDCGSACIRYAGEVAWVKSLDLKTGQATDVFPITTADFQDLGVDVSSVYAYAAIPEVSLMSVPSQQNLGEGGKVLLPTLRAEYQIRAAGSYDWSSGPVPTVNGSMAMWQEILTAADTPGQTAAGADHGRQTHDADFTFLAGFLLGLAGSVVLAGIQLLLPSAAGSGTGRKGVQPS